MDVQKFVFRKPGKVRNDVFTVREGDKFGLILVPNQGDKYDISVTFASVLEMMKARTLDAEQKKIFGDIKVKATDRLFEDKIELKEN